MRKRISTILVAIVFALLLSACGASSQLVDALSEGDIRTANRIYIDKIDGNRNERVEFNEKYDKYLSALYDELNQNKRSVDEVEDIIDDLSDFNHPSVFEDYEEDFYSLIESKRAYAEGMEYLANVTYPFEYMNAYDCFMDVIEADINYEQAQRTAEDSFDNYVEAALTLADVYINNEEYQKAVSNLEAAVSFLADRGLYSSSVENKLAECEQKEADYAVNTYINDANEYIADGDYETGIHNLAYAHVEWPNNTDAVSALYNACKTYANYALDEAADYFTSLQDYKAAVATLENVEEYFEEIDEYLSQDVCIENILSLLETALEYYESFEPVELTNKNTFYSDKIIYDINKFNDNLGNSYDGGYMYKTNASATYNVDGYDTFSCRVVIPEEHKNDDYCGSVTIYTDGNEIYTSGAIGKGTYPVDMLLNISGARELTISFVDNYGASTFYNMVDGTLVLVKPVVYKTLANYPAFADRIA